MSLDSTSPLHLDVQKKAEPRLQQAQVTEPYLSEFARFFSIAQKSNHDSICGSFISPQEIIAKILRF